MWSDRARQVMTDRRGRRNAVGVSRGAVREPIVARLKAVAAATLPPQLAALVALTPDPYPQALVDTAVTRMAFGRIAPGSSKLSPYNAF